MLTLNISSSVYDFVIIKHCIYFQEKEQHSSEHFYWIIHDGCAINNN